MCGIAGILGGSEPINEKLLAHLGRRLAHRGPDGQQTWVSHDRSCGFVHTRLAIIDADARSDQPFVSDDGRYTIIFNGEIFNFLELRAELAAKGYVFRTEGDTEVLLNGYIAWGPAMLNRLNGMWALAIRDNADGSIFFARDRFGIKPLLYAHSGTKLAFASEIRALLEIPWVDTSPAMEVAQRLLFDPFGVEGSEHTLHQGIRRLPGGHSAKWAQGQLELTRWWVAADHLETETPANMHEAADRFRELFFDSTRLRMRSDVAIGSCLSGGFDSTAVVSAMAHIAGLGGGHERESRDWRHAFVATFTGQPHDETPEATQAAQHAGITPHFFDLGGDDGEDFVDPVLDALDDVYISLPTSPWRIYQEVRRSGVRVTLDGHGADELMGGYRQGGQNIAFALRNLIGDRAGNGGVGPLASDVAKLAALRFGQSYYLRQHRLTPPPRLPIAAYGDALPEYYSGLDRRLYAMFNGSILPTILRNFDRLSMAHGVEVRMPFMDWRLATYVMALPQKMKTDDTHSKLVARTALAGIMPETIRTSTRKVGFNSQMPAWMKGSLGHWAQRLLSTPHDAFDQIVDRHALKSRITQLTAQGAWDWTSVGRLWPYINMKWYLDHRCP
ncbi:asparagine synthase (glutamine-hydrolyzing) [Sphingorhabdus sp. IMCC26285]|uniref:asparagine synthase (glutamine-hydrolyzing) n=1 Tax=Sphingorhabdus profundilacus TaxID=2509718 RepID=A0A6I4M2A3_9SPHN|nr:asparagine synthase (glutamine-hydrolyzing) [Sphingorhabdus profundilacus]MVZ98463.1 asparagine synthase (glutamine-hydrolyzing) [Sphingorhabdus profundilacus]